MAKDALLPSLIDRIALGDSGRLPASGMSDEQFRACVLRDLTWLLNTTRLESIEPLKDFELVRKSVLNFGVDSFSGVTIAEVDEGKVAAAIARAIAIFEPRLRHVLVNAVRQVEGSRERIVLTIDAELMVRPLRDIRFHGSLDLDSNEISLQQSAGGR